MTARDPLRRPGQSCFGPGDDGDVSALGRQGFDFETARRVIDCDDPAGLEAEIAAT